MKKIITYEVELSLISPRKWEQYLKERSGLPGGINLKLAQAFARTGTIIDFKKFVSFRPEEAPENTPESFLTFCGIVGLGYYLSKYHDTKLFSELRRMSNDPRQSMRRAAVMALQTIGKKDKIQLINELNKWVNGSYLEQYSVIKALCNCKVQMSKREASQVLDILDLITVNILDGCSGDENFNLLKKELSCSWSVGVAKYPRKGKMLMEHWIKEDNSSVNSIMNASLKILKPLEPEWADNQLSKLSV